MSILRVLIPLLLIVIARLATAQTVVSDAFDVATAGTGFALNAGVNAGINPPVTRLRGSAAANLRYLSTATKADSAYSIAGNKLQVTAAATPGRFVLSQDGTTPFNFGPALGVSAATPLAPVIYEVRLRISNGSAGTQRCSFALGTTEGDANSWAFGIQVYRTNSGNSYYQIGKRIVTTASGLAANLNEPITTLTGNTYGNEITLWIRVTDAGPETTSFHSRVQVSLNGGNSWLYDTDTDPDLVNGWRFNGAGRYLMWDAAPDAGPITYDDFSLTLNPPASNANTSQVFRAMSFNIHSARGPDGKVNTQRIADFIIDNRVDLVGMNEVARNSTRADNRDLIGELARETGMTFVFSNNVTTLSGNDEFGNAILSKYPVIFRDHRFLPKVGDNEQRGWLKAIVDVNGKFVSFWTTHLDFHADDTERLKCGTNLNKWLADETFPVLVCGDFNDTPGSSIGVLMSEKWTDVWPVAGDGSLGRTVPCPGPPFNARIDYIWKADNAPLKPQNAFVGYALEASDHYSVLSDFVLSNYNTYVTGFYFPFDQGSGTKATDTLGGLSATWNSTSGPIWTTDSPTGQPGDYSLYFNGSRKISLIDTNQVLGTNGVNGDFTLQAWVKLPTGYSPAQPAVLFQYERRPGFALCINTNRSLYLRIFNSRDFATSATIPNDYGWHHVAVVHSDGNDLRFYIDGSLASTITYRKGPGFGISSVLTIGSDSSGGGGFTGYLDRPSFENRALAVQELDFPAMPKVEIGTASGNLSISWLAGKISYGLERNSVLGAVGWTPVPVQLRGGRYEALVQPSESAQFFRLVRK